MALKLLVFAVVAATASAGFLTTIKLNSPEVFLLPPPDNIPVFAKAKAAHDGFNEYTKNSRPPRYTFGYSIREKNGTLFAQYARRTDNVTYATYGTYSQICLDGSRIAVDYAVDDRNSFRIISTPLTLTGHLSPIEYAAIAGRNAGALPVVTPLAKSTAPKDPLAASARAIHRAFGEFIKDMSVSHYSLGTEVEYNTGIVGNCFETMVGDSTRGTYTQIKPDGSRRTVDYSDDLRNGFQAMIRDPISNVISIFYI